MFEGDSCGILSAIHEQSSDINRGVEKGKEEEQGAGDQGMMFGFASRETKNYMPLPIALAHDLLIELSKLRRENNEIKYLRPDAKSQVTIEYSDDHKPVRIDTIVVSTQHDEFINPTDNTKDAQISADEEICDQIKHYIINILIPREIKNIT